MAALTERGMPVVLTGVALPESSVHSPNEKLPVEYLTKASTRRASSTSPSPTFPLGLGPGVRPRRVKRAVRATISHG